MFRLQKQRRKYEGMSGSFLIALIVLIAYLSYTVWILPSIYSLVHYANVTILLISVVTLVLFFATGLYSEKIAYAYKFVPQANRAMRPFNIYLNTRVRSRLSWLNPFRITSTPAPPPLSRQASLSLQQQRRKPTTTDDTATNLRRSTSNSSSSSVASARSAGAIRSRTPSRSPSPSAATPTTASSSSPVTRAIVSPPSTGSTPRSGVPIPPIPPATNPRGEMIFSSRVSSAFREGYERYRAEWERRRTEAAKVQHAHNNKGWFGWMLPSPTMKSLTTTKPGVATLAAGSTSTKGSRPGTPSGDDFSRGRTSMSGFDTPPSNMGSKASSRHASPHRSTTKSSRASTPSHTRPTTPSNDLGTSRTEANGQMEGRIRAESFSALLQTLEEDNPSQIKNRVAPG
ncbi:hypothetical protein OIO90_002234 [Microbotryomycetes sp. JL221]|nr:hypothetical protein OIO90_002234 [Microbotryomycetes sp. JL221]